MVADFAVGDIAVGGIVAVGNTVVVVVAGIAEVVSDTVVAGTDHVAG